MRILAADIETVDKYLTRGLGPGWVYGLNNPQHDYQVLGCAFATETKSIYITDHNKICDMLMKADVLVFHNAQYDLGGLLYVAKSLGRLDVVEKLQTVEIYCTKIMAMMNDTSLMSYSLDDLGKRYFRYKKDNESLVNAALDEDLFPWTKKDLNAKMKALANGETYERNVDRKKVEKFCKENMDLLQEHCLQVVAKYATVDAEITVKLFNYLKDRSYDMKAVKFYCNMCRIVNNIRAKGVWVDSQRIKEVSCQLQPVIDGKLNDVFEIAGGEFNINSGKQLAEVCDNLNIKYGKTAKGNPEITTPWMSKQEHPLFKAMVEARKYMKIKRDFVDKLEEIREFTDPGTSRYFRIYPHMQVMGAITGRFSSSGPNIQQIPARDPVLGPLCRSMFVPKKGSKWYSLDYSNQEGRIQVHYAAVNNCEGASELVQEFKLNPKFDMHQKIADLAGISRSQAKTINLGLSYGMGKKKLAESLKLSEEQAILLIQRYHDVMPYLKDLSRSYMEQMKTQGFIITLGKRRNHLDKPMIIEGEKVTFEYKALNKLVQGSAADQIMAAMYLGEKAGIDIIFAVHDQLCVQGTREDAERMRDIMNSCYKLEIPMYTDVDLNGGLNWAESGH